MTWPSKQQSAQKKYGTCSQYLPTTNLKLKEHWKSGWGTYMCHSAWPVTAVVGQGPPSPRAWTNCQLAPCQLQHTTCRAFFNSTQLNCGDRVPTTTTTQRSGKKRKKKIYVPIITLGAMHERHVFSSMASATAYTSARTREMPLGGPPILHGFSRSHSPRAATPTLVSI